MRRIAALGAAYAAITLLVVSPLVDFRNLQAASYEGDARLLIWTLAWDAHAVLTGASLFDANIFHPEPRALSYAEHHIGIGVFAAPLYAVTANPILTYWVLWLLAFPLNGLAMYALARHVTRDEVAAFVAGCVYAFCFFRMHHAHGHIQLLWTWMLPLVPVAADAWLERPTAARATAVTALVLAAALTTWYLAVFAGLLALVCLACMVPGRPIGRGHILQALVAGAVAALVLGWFARPYLGLTPGPIVEAAANAADLRSYLVPPANTWPGQVLARYTSIETRWIWGEQTLYVGVAVLVLCATGIRFLVGAVNGREARIAAAVLVTGSVAMALSFGPTPTGLSPFDLVVRIPGLGLLRAPARFALLVMMAAALLAACGVTWARRRFAVRGSMAVATLLVLFFVESFVVGFPAGKPPRVDVPAVYRVLARLPRAAVLSLPTYRGTPEAFRESDYLLFSTVHWQPIVNGFGRQEPPEHGARMEVLAAFPAPESIALMRDLGIRYVVLHTRRASELAARAEGAAVRLVLSADGDFLFEVR